MMATEECSGALGVSGSAWSPATMSDAGGPRFNSPSKCEDQGPHFLVPIKSSAAARRASHCSGLTSVDGRLAKPSTDARALRGVSFRRRPPTDCEGLETSKHSLLRSSAERGVQFAPDSDDDEGPLHGHADLRNRPSSPSGSDNDYASPSRSRRRSAAPSSLHLPALPAGSLTASLPTSTTSPHGATSNTAVPTAGPTGVTLAFLDSLRATSRPGATLRDVFRTLVLPATRNARCAYVHLLGAGGDYRARPTHVLVCSWDERVLDVVDLLQDFVAGSALSGAGGAAAGNSPGGSTGGGGGGAAALASGPVPPVVASDSTMRAIRRRRSSGFAPGDVICAALDGSGGGAAGGGVGPGTGAASAGFNGGSGGGAASAAVGEVNDGDGSPTYGAPSTPVFAVWLDLLAVNFHLPAAAGPSAAASAAAAFNCFTAGTRGPASRQPGAAFVDVVSQERSRAVPSAIAATRSVLLLPGPQGAALREPPCMVAVWHALRGRGCAGGTSLAVAAPPDLDVGLVQAAFETLALSSKAPGDETAGAAGAGTQPASQMSPDRIAVRARREGATFNAASNAAAIYAADPLPSRTVRDGVTAAAVATATALLSRPVGTGGGAAISHAMSASTLLPTPPGPGHGTVLQARSCSVTVMESSQPPHPPTPPAALPSPLSSSRLVLLPSPLRLGSGGAGVGGGGGGPLSPGIRSSLGMSMGEAWTSTCGGSPTSSGQGLHGGTLSGGGGGAGSLLRLPSGRSMSFTNMPLTRAAAAVTDRDDEDDGPSSCGPACGGAAAAFASSGGGGSSASTSGLHGGLGGGGGRRGSDTPIWVTTASDSGLAPDGQAARRGRSLAPLLDVTGPVAGAADGTAAGAAPLAGSSRLNLMRRRSQAPWEASGLFSNPAGLTSVGPHGTSILSGSASPPHAHGSETSGGVGGDDAAGPLSQPGPFLAHPAAGAALSANSLDPAPQSVPIPKLAPLHGYPHTGLPGAAAAAVVSPPPMVLTSSTSSAPLPLPLPLLQPDGRNQLGPDPATAVVAGVVSEDGALPSPFSARRPAAGMHGLPPRFERRDDSSDEGIGIDVDRAVDAAATVDYDSDVEQDVPAIVLDGGAAANSFLTHARSTPPEVSRALAGMPPHYLLQPAASTAAASMNTAASSRPFGAISSGGGGGGGVRLLHAPHAPPSPPPPSLSPPPAGGGNGVRGSKNSLDLSPAAAALPCASTPHRPLSPDLARLVAAAKLLAALDQPTLALRLARHAYNAARGMHGFNHPDTARCALALATLAHHYNQQAAVPSAQPPPLPTVASAPVPRPGGFAAGLRHGNPVTGGGGSGSGACSPRCMSPARSRLALNSTATSGATAAGTAAGSANGGGATATAAAAAMTSSYCEDPEGYLRGAAVVLERFFGPDHEEVVAARQGLAAVLATAGRHEEVLALLQRAAAGRTAQRRPPSEAAMVSALDLAASLAASGRQREARKLLKAQIAKLEEDEDDAAAVAAATVMAARGRIGSAGPFPNPGAAAAPAYGSGAYGSPVASSSSAHPLQAHLPAGQAHAHTHALPQATPSAKFPPPALLALGGTDSPGLRLGGLGGGLGGGASAVASAANSACPSPGSGSPAQSQGQGQGHGHGQQGSAAARGLTALKRAELLAKCAHTLAQLKAAAGKTQSARLLYRRAIESYSTVYGGRHTITAGAMLGLAALCHAAREYGEALELYRTVLDVYVEVYGPHHAATTRISNRLGAVEEALEDEQAEEEEARDEAAATAAAIKLAAARAAAAAAMDDSCSGSDMEDEGLRGGRGGRGRDSAGRSGPVALRAGGGRMEDDGERSGSTGRQGGPGRRLLAPVRLT